MKSFSLVFLEPGDKVLVVHRRLFKEDTTRFFLGVVEGFNEANGLLKVAGYSISPAAKGGFRKKRDKATKIHSLTSGGLMVYLLDVSVNPETASVELAPNGSVQLKDGKRTLLDLTESSETE